MKVSYGSIGINSCSGSGCEAMFICIPVHADDIGNETALGWSALLQY